MRKLFDMMLGLCIWALPGAAQEQESDLKIPAEVAPFIECGTKAVRLETADLNGDERRGDFVLVHEQRKTRRDKDGFPMDQRPLLILVRQPITP